MDLEVRPLTPDLWPALKNLFGENGACYGCWCMYWRIGATYRKRPRSQNKADFRKVIKNGPPPGLLLFDKDVAVGWCQITPRDALPHLAKVGGSSEWMMFRCGVSPVSTSARAIEGGESPRH